MLLWASTADKQPEKLTVSCKKTKKKNNPQPLKKVVLFLFLFFRFFKFVFYLNFKRPPVICQLSRQNKIRAPDICILSVLSDNMKTHTVNTKFKLSLILVHLQPSIQDWRSFKEWTQDSTQDSFFLFVCFGFAGSCLFQHKVTLPSCFKDRKKKVLFPLSYWWWYKAAKVPPESCWRCPGSLNFSCHSGPMALWQVPPRKEKKKKSTETKPDRVLPSTVPFDVCVSSSWWGWIKTQPPVRCCLCLDLWPL